MSSLRTNLRQTILATSVAALLSGVSAHADLTWDSAATATNNWSTADGNTNWLPGNVVWTQNENAIFDITSGTPEAIDVTTAITFNDITFGVTGFSIGSGGAGSFSLADDLASTITVTNAGETASIGETIANNTGGASTLTKEGAGTLTLNGTANNTYSGGTIINAGILQAAHLGALGTGTVTNNGTLNLTATTAGDVDYTGLSLVTNTMTGAGTVNVTLLTGTSTRRLNGNYSGFTGTWNVGVGTAAGGGKVQMNGLDNAATTINVLTNATVYTNGVNGVGVTHNASIVLNGGDTGETLGQLRVEGGAAWAGPVSLAGAITGANDAYVGSNAGIGTISGVISEAGGVRLLTKGGAGTLVLSGTNTYTGGTRVLAGSLSVSVLNNTGIAGNVGTGGTIGLGNGATGVTLAYTGAGETTDRVINLASTIGNNTLDSSGAGLLNLTSAMTATGVGGKTLTLSGTGSGQLAAGLGSIFNNGANLGTTAAAAFATNLGAITVTSTAGIVIGATIAGTGIAGGTRVTSITGAGPFTIGLSANTNGAGALGQAINFTAPNALNKTGNGTWTLSGANSYSGNTAVTAGTLALSGTFSGTGATTVSGGTLKLDYGGSDTTKLPDASVLTFGGGTVELSGGSHTEIVASTALTASTISAITRSSGSAVLALNGINRGAGAFLNIGGNNIASSDLLNTNGILGTWATVTNAGVTDFAANSTNTLDGLITAYTGYTDVTRLDGVIPNAATNNVRIINGGTTANVALAAAATTINTLKMEANAGAATIAPSASFDTFSIGDNTGGAVLQDSGASGLTIGTAADDGVLTTGGVSDSVAASLLFSNQSVSNSLVVNSTISNNGTDVVGIAKNGPGVLVLAGNNNYTGPTALAAGTIRAGSSTALGIGGALTMAAGTTLDLNENSLTVANLTAAATATVTDNGAGTGTSTLIVSANQAAALGNLFTNGATRDVAVTLANANAGHNVLNNPGNTFAGGLTLANSAAGTRLVPPANTQVVGGPGAIVSGIYGRGPITVGEFAGNKAGIFLSAANTTIVNDIVSNTTAGTDRVGTIRLDTIGNVFSGTLTANFAPFAFSTNGTGAVRTTGKITGPSGLTLLSHNLGGTSLTVTLANTGPANDYAGDTIINQNPFAGRSYTLALGAADQIPNGAGFGNVIINTASTGVGTLNLAGFSDTINGLNGSGTVDGTSGTPVLTLGDNDADGTFTGIIKNTAGSLSLIKTGAGTQTLSGANTYSGTTSVNGGKLILSGSLAGGATVATGATLSGSATLGGNLSVASGGTLELGNAGVNPMTVASITLGALAGDTANIILGNLGGGANAAVLNVTSPDGFVANGGAGSVTLTANLIGLSSGVYKLIGYNGAAIGTTAFTPAFTIGGRQAPPVLQDNAGVQIELNLTSDSVKWTGLNAGGEWTTNVLAPNKNWKLASSNDPTDFIAADVVVFDDSNTGLTTVDISTGDVTPGSVTFANNALDYTIEGTSGIAGGTSIVKSGTAEVTLATPNTHTGGVIVNAGKLNINNPSAIGAGALTLNAGTIDNTSGAPVDAGTSAQNWNGNFTFAGTNELTLGAAAMNASRTVTVTAGKLGIAGVVSGAGFDLTKDGPGALSLNGANTYSGVTTILAGTLIAQNNLALGATTAGTTVTSGATLDLGGTLGIGALNLGTEVITVSGTGVDGNGALVNNGSNDQINATGRVVLAGNTTFGGTRRWDLRSSAPTLNMAGFTITKEGANQISLVGTVVSNPGHLIINAGTFGFETTTNPGGNATNTVTVNAAGTLLLYGNTVVFPWAIALNNGTMTQNNTNATASGPVTLAAGNSTINVPATSLTLSGVLSGAGGFTKGGGGALILTNVNTYDGATTIAAGTLRVGIANAIPDGVGKGDVTVNGTLDVNGIAETINGLSGGGIVDNIPAGATTLSIGSGDANGTFTGTIRDTGGALTLRKIGAGTQTVSGTQEYATLITEAGTMNVDSALGAGASTVNANGGTTNFGVSQTLAALNIGAGATVVLTAAAAPEGELGGGGLIGAGFGGDGGESSVAAVPEPGSAALIFGGALALLGIRRRRNA